MYESHEHDHKHENRQDNGSITGLINIGGNHSRIEPKTNNKTEDISQQHILNYNRNSDMQDDESLVKYRKEEEESKSSDVESREGKCSLNIFECE